MQNEYWKKDFIFCRIEQSNLVVSIELRLHCDYLERKANDSDTS